MRFIMSILFPRDQRNLIHWVSNFAHYLFGHFVFYICNHILLKGVVRTWHSNIYLLSEYITKLMLNFSTP